MEILAADIGGTHARFALATIDAGQVAALGDAQVFKTAAYASLEAALEAFRATLGRPLPTAAAMAVACPVGGETLKLTNNPWVLRPAEMRRGFAPDALVLVNDFGAVAHAAARLGPEHFRPVCGPAAWPEGDGLTTVLGPGTGLGVAQLARRAGRAIVLETEGGHVGFAPQDAFEDHLLARLRERYGRVSLERILSGPGLAHIHAVLAQDAGAAAPEREDAELWRAALEGREPLASDALRRFCAVFGTAAGDFVLGQGADSLVLAGGVGARLADRLSASAFVERFGAKGRFAERMAATPVRLIAHPQPGLYGAAAAFAEAF